MASRLPVRRRDWIRFRSTVLSPESDYGLHRRRRGFKEEIRQWQDAQHQYSGTNPQPREQPVRYAVPAMVVMVVATVSIAIGGQEAGTLEGDRRFDIVVRLPIANPSILILHRISTVLGMDLSISLSGTGNG